MAECKTEKCKHIQRKNFRTAGKQIVYNFSTCIVALNDEKKDVGYKLRASLSVQEESANYI